MRRARIPLRPKTRIMAKPISPLAAAATSRALSRALNTLQDEAMAAAHVRSTIQALTGMPFAPQSFPNPHKIRGAVDVLSRLVRKK